MNANQILKIPNTLKKNSFPAVKKSDEVIMALGDAEIGTDDSQIIEDKISPAGNPSVQIRIGWPDDGSSGKKRIFSLDWQRQKEVISQVVLCGC